MSKFKVGDKVKTRYGIGKIVEIDKENLCPYLVYHDSWNQGHDGNGFSKKEYSGNHCCWFEEYELSLVKPTKTTEIKIDFSGIKLICDNLKTTNLIVDRNQELYDWYEKNVKKKEGNDMLESLNLVDLYASKQKEKILKEENEKIEELKGKCEIINKFKALKGKFQEDCKNLYLSQFTEEEKEQILVTGDCIDDNRLPLRSNQDLSQEYFINEDFEPEGYETIRNEARNKLNEIDSLIKTAKAHVSIAKTKEEVEEILTRYEILDKKGKLKI